MKDKSGCARLYGCALKMLIGVLDFCCGQMTDEHYKRALQVYYKSKTIWMHNSLEGVMTTAYNYDLLILRCACYPSFLSPIPFAAVGQPLIELRLQAWVYFSEPIFWLVWGRICHQDWVHDLIIENINSVLGIITNMMVILNFIVSVQEQPLLNLISTRILECLHKLQSA